jgi:hypothetical protein
MVRIRITAIEFSRLTLLPLIFALLLYYTIPISNFEPISIVSVTASINLTIWIFIIFQIIFNLGCFYFRNFKFVLNFNLYLTWVYVLAIKLLIDALSLKGTPLPKSDIRGDLLSVVQLAQRAETNYWSGSGYPPLWPSLIGNLARLFNVHVLSVFKPIEFMLLVVSPFLVYLSWNLVVKKWIALVVTIQLMLITSFNYKNLVLYLLIPLVIFVLKQSYFHNKGYSHNRFRQLFFGILIGFISLLYYGYIYWIVPFMIIVAISALFSTKKFTLSELINYFYLGLGLPLGPIIYHMSESETLQFYVLMISSIFFLEFCRKYFKLFKYIHIFISMVVIVLLFEVFFLYRIHDTWFEGGIAENNPSSDPILELEKFNLLLLSILVFLVYKFLVDRNLSIIISIVLGIYLSSTIFMYLIASQMQVSRRVDLWPRAQEVQSYSVNLIFLLILLFIVDILAKKYNLEKFISTASSTVLLPATFGLVLIGSYFVSTLGGQAYYSMPYHAFNGAWYAHQGCSNPQKDPMLAKVFENYPDIQDFLRAKCSSVTWEKTPPIK